MKKILFVFFAASMLAVSCSMDGTYTEQYPYVSSFDYSDKVYETEFGSDSLYFDAEGKEGFPYGDIAFYHKVADDKTFKGGFLLSRLKAAGVGDKDKDYVVNEYRVAGPRFKDNQDNTYAVFVENKDASLMPAKDVKFLASQYGSFDVSHCWVNNTDLVYETAKEVFENGDKLVLTATGYRGGVMTGTASINLALPDTTIYNWTKFDLSALGSVDEINFELSSSRSDFPKAFCLDELSGRVNIQY